MKSDVILVNSEGDKIEKALDLAERVSDYRRLAPKSRLQLRLLTEEMMGLMRAVTGERFGDFWIEDEDGTTHLHLKVETVMNSVKRDQLLSAATSGKNEAARGIMGTLIDLFDRDCDSDVAAYTAPILTCGMEGGGLLSAANLDWSLTVCRENLAGQDGSEEAWDELEKSVVSHVADDVRVRIRGREVEMIIDKKMV